MYIIYTNIHTITVHCSVQLTVNGHMYHRVTILEGPSPVYSPACVSGATWFSFQSGISHIAPVATYPYAYSPSPRCNVHNVRPPPVFYTIHPPGPLHINSSMVQTLLYLTVNGHMYIVHMYSIYIIFKCHQKTKLIIICIIVWFNIMCSSVHSRVLFGIKQYIS